jgi:mono/diheme cytochrome c family protein
MPRVLALIRPALIAAAVPAAGQTELPASAGAVAPEPSTRGGERLYARHCRSCHGPKADMGRSGDIRDSDCYRIRNATGGIEQMPEVDLSDDEIRAIAAYLAHLNEAF